MRKFLIIFLWIVTIAISYGGSPVKLNMYSVHSGAIADGVHRVRIAVEIQDSSSQLVDTATNIVTFTLQSGSGSFEGSEVVLAKSGRAMINLISPTSAGNATVVCNSPGLSSDNIQIEWIAPRIPFTKFPMGVYEDVSPWWWNNFSNAITDIRNHNLDSCMMGNGKVGRDEGVLDDAEAAAFDMYMGLAGTIGESGGTFPFITPDFYDDSTPTIQEARVQANMVLDTWGQDYDCIQSWYTADEPGNHLLTHVDLITQAFREQDMVRPATPVLIGKERVRNHYNQSELDVLCVDLYPAGFYNAVGDFTMRHWGYNYFNMVSYYRYITQDKHAGIPVWIVLQTHNFETQLRQPEPEEVRCMHWLAIAEGVKGYFWFIYSPIASQWNGLRDQPANFNEVSSLASRLKANGNMICDLLLDCQRVPDVCTVSGPMSPSYIQPHISTLMQNDGSSFYTVAVNHDCQNTRNLTIDSWCYDYIKDLETSTQYALPATISFAAGDGKIFELITQQVNPPAPVENLTVASKTEKRISLGWEPPLGSEPYDGYNVYDGDNNLIGTAYSPAFEVTDLIAGQLYCFSVCAFNNAGESAARAICDSTLAYEPPSMPDDVEVVDITSHTVEIEWEASADNAGIADYDVYLNDSYAGTTTQTSYIFDCAPLQVYRFNVIARDLDGGLSPVTPAICAQTCEDSPPSEMQGHWPFEQGNGTIAYDISNYNRDGSIVGAQWTEGYFGNALDFDGTSDKVNAGAFDVSGSELTITAWVNARSFLPFSSDNRIVSKSIGSGEQDHYWMLSTISNNGGVRLRFRLKTDSNTNTLKGTSEEIPIGQWVHVAAVYDGTTMKLYKNAVADSAEMAKTGTIDSGPGVDVLIGSNASDYAEWDGLIDEIRIYNKALSASELSMIMAGINPLPSSGGQCWCNSASDFNCDCTVDLTDFSYIAENWGLDTFPGLGDIIVDDVVDIADAVQFVSDWLDQDFN